MSTKMYIFGEGWLSCSRNLAGWGLSLERDLDDFVQYRGAVIWDGDEDEGPRWNVDVLLHENAEDVDGWIQRLTAFFQQWGVQDRSLAFTIVGEGAPKWEHRRVELGSE